MNLQTDQLNYLQILGREIRKLASSSDHATNLILDIYHPRSEKNDNATAEIESGRPKIEKLSFMALKLIFKNYKKGAIHSYLQLEDKIWIGERLDINKKLEDIIDLDNEVFWRRVAEMDCTDKIALMDAKKSEKNYWKSFGIKSRFTKLLETTSPSDFMEEKFIPLAKSVSGYITDLNIKQMIPLKEELVKKSRYNPRYVYRHYPSEICHHLRLGVVLKELTNLTSLSLEYVLKRCEYTYKKRFFEISYEDVEDLANGIAALTKLKSFRFQHTRLNDEKLRILTLALITLPHLETLELLYCNLTDNSGISMGHLIQNCPTLKSLNLKGNQLQALACQGIGYGLQERREPLEFLGLSRCPIGTEGLCRIGGALKGTEHCPKLDFSFCTVGENGAMFAAEMFSFHKHLVALNISGIPLGYSNGQILIKNLKDCFYLIELECRSCFLTKGQESQLRVIVERNIYYQHHPYLLKNSFSEKDEDEIENLLEITRRNDIERIYENCELLKPQKDIYPDDLGDMKSTYVTDFPEAFLADFTTDAEGTEIKIVRSSNTVKNSETVDRQDKLCSLE